MWKTSVGVQSAMEVKKKKVHSVHISSIANEKKKKSQSDILKSIINITKGNYSMLYSTVNSFLIGNCVFEQPNYDGKTTEPPTN